MTAVWRSHGSSPRAWGTACLLPDDPLICRFIPTRVGNSGTRSARPAPASVHPHARGEQTPIAWPTRCPCGSSPRAWGTDTDRVADALPMRFIPTRVGNSSGSFARTVATAVHPHARGEQPNPVPGGRESPSSSPRAWGTVPELRHPPVRSRFIPTRVGNRTRSWHRSSAAAVHPHARGEQVEDVEIASWEDGSSPRAWGTGVPGATKSVPRRFIPTRVGNRAAGPLSHDGDHGSSPRAWGTGVGLFQPRVDDRFIPTRVGNRQPVRDATSA